MKRVDVIVLFLVIVSTFSVLQTRSVAASGTQQVDIDFVAQGGAFLLDFSVLTSGGAGNMKSVIRSYDTETTGGWGGGRNFPVDYNIRTMFLVGQDSQAGKEVDEVRAGRTEIVLSASHSAGSGKEDPNGDYQVRFVNQFLDQKDAIVSQLNTWLATATPKDKENILTEIDRFSSSRLLVVAHDGNSKWTGGKITNGQWPFARPPNGDIIYVRYIGDKDKVKSFMGTSFRSLQIPGAINVLTSEDHWSIASSKQLQQISFEMAIAMCNPTVVNGEMRCSKMTMQEQREAVKKVLLCYEDAGIILTDIRSGWNYDAAKVQAQPFKEYCGGIVKRPEVIQAEQIRQQAPVTPAAEKKAAGLVSEAKAKDDVVNAGAAKDDATKLAGEEQRATQMEQIKARGVTSAQGACQDAKYFSEVYNKCKIDKDTTSDDCKPRPFYSVKVYRMSSGEGGSMCVFEKQPVKAVQSNGMWKVKNVDGLTYEIDVPALVDGIRIDSVTGLTKKQVKELQDKKLMDSTYTWGYHITAEVKTNYGTYYYNHPCRANLCLFKGYSIITNTPNNKGDYFVYYGANQQKEAQQALKDKNVQQTQEGLEQQKQESRTSSNPFLDAFATPTNMPEPSIGENLDLIGMKKDHWYSKEVDVEHTAEFDFSSGSDYTDLGNGKCSFIVYNKDVTPGISGSKVYLNYMIVKADEKGASLEMGGLSQIFPYSCYASYGNPAQSAAGVSSDGAIVSGMPLWLETPVRVQFNCKLYDNSFKSTNKCEGSVLTEIKDVRKEYTKKPLGICSEQGDNFKCQPGCSDGKGEREFVSPDGKKLCSDSQKCCETNLCKLHDDTNSNTCRKDMCLTGETDMTHWLTCFGTDKCCAETKCFREIKGNCKTYVDDQDVNYGCGSDENPVGVQVRGDYCNSGSLVCCQKKSICEMRGYACREVCSEGNEEIPVGDAALDKSCLDYDKNTPSCCKPAQTPITPTQTATGCGELAKSGEFNIALAAGYKAFGKIVGDCVRVGGSGTSPWYINGGFVVNGKVSKVEGKDKTWSSDGLGSVTLKGPYASQADCDKAKVAVSLSPPGEDVIGGLFSNYNSLDADNTGILTDFIGIAPNQGWTITGIDFNSKLNSALIKTSPPYTSCGPDCIQWRGTVGTMHASRCMDPAGRFTSCLGNYVPSSRVDCNLNVDEVVSASGHAPWNSVDNVQFSYIIQIFSDDALISGQPEDCASAQGAITGWWNSNSINGISYSTTSISSSSLAPYAITFAPNVLMVSGAAVMSKVAVTPGTCTPETNDAFCIRLRKACGQVTANDNCGDYRVVGECGSCPVGQTCTGNQCIAPNPIPCNNDGKIDAGEECDGDNLNDKTCQTQGFDLGILRCKADCKFDTSSCERSGEVSIPISAELTCVKVDNAAKPTSKNHYWELVLSLDDNPIVSLAEKKFFDNSNSDGSFDDTSVANKITFHDSRERGDGYATAVTAVATPVTPTPPVTPTAGENSNPTIDIAPGKGPVIVSELGSTIIKELDGKTFRIPGVLNPVTIKISDKETAAKDLDVKTSINGESVDASTGRTPAATDAHVTPPVSVNVDVTATDNGKNKDGSIGQTKTTTSSFKAVLCPSTIIASSSPTSKFGGVTVNSRVDINFFIMKDQFTNTNPIPFTGTMSVSIEADTSTLEGVINDGTTASANFGWVKRVDARTMPGYNKPVNPSNPWILIPSQPCTQGQMGCAITPGEVRDCILRDEECTFQSTAYADLGAQMQGFSQTVAGWKTSKIKIVFDLTTKKITVSDAANPIKSRTEDLTVLNGYSMVRLLHDIGDYADEAKLADIFGKCTALGNYDGNKVGTVTVSPLGTITYTITSPKMSYYYLSNPLLINKEGFAVKLSSETVPEKAFTRIFIYNGNDNKTSLYRFEDSEVEPDCDVTIMNDTEINVPASGGNFSALGVGFSFPDGTFKDGARVEVQGVWVSNCKIENPAGATSSQDVWIIILGIVVLIIIVVVIIVMAMKERNRDFLN